MQIGTLVWIMASAMAALAIVLFQYYYKAKKKGGLGVLLSFLRFLALFGTFLLLINPKFTKNEYTLEKANLVLLADNSSSIQTTNGQQDIVAVIDELKETEAITDQFNLVQYRFGTGMEDLDTLTFTDKSTDIAKAMAAVRNIYSNTKTAVLLVTDGNQTLGEDYEFYGRDQQFPVYPVVIGDTTRYEDIRVAQVNSNKYTFLKNKYPIEAYISYEGVGNIETIVHFSVDGKRVFSQNIRLSNTSNTEIINTLLDADIVGVKTIGIQVVPLKNERNTINNHKDIAIEVIDEKTDITIVTSMLHPDIGALKKAIESNQQRSVSIKKPNTGTKELDDDDLLILYQPNSSFTTIYEYIEQKKPSIFTITGPKTDWNFLNKIQNSFEKNDYDQTEEVTPILNPGFSIFNNADLSVVDFPPLESNLGETIISKKHEVVLGQRVKGVELNEPLFAVLGDDSEREAILFGENIWKWRMQGYRNDRSFKNFDAFLGKVILYLTTKKPKNRLVIDYESLYEGNSEAKITATYFDETFVFDSNASLILKLNDRKNEVSKEIPMLLKGGYYEADLTDLPAGSYDFKATVNSENLSKSGSFTILDFDVEQQFLSSDHKKLDRLAQRTDGKLYFPSETDELISNLMGNNRLLPTRKSKQNVVSLIDFRILLGIIITALSAEWFIRKYNGLI